MKKSLVYFIYLLAIQTAAAQSIERAVMGAAGGFINQGPNSLSFTVGQTLTETVSIANNILTQGFQQPNEMASKVYEISTVESQVEVYPNPASAWIKVSIKSKTNNDFLLMIYNVLGNVVRQEFMVASNTESIIEIADLPGGTYFIRLTANQFTGVIRFIKTTD